MRWLLPLLGPALLLAACSSDQDIESLEVGRSNYGDEWPLTVDEAVLACEPGDVTTLTVDGRSYGLDGLSGGAEPEAGLRRILAQNPVDGARGGLAALAEDAQELCD
ncbi:DUF2511 domain-containing protein [Nocardioides sp. SR21]|uniref:DUF2511 domain-containing protein n=1 Tax=Nocardioides sp. SR21 TaxID=2919501 RepID=UPI001FAB0B16|nr:DUF2511 domain-containing protein [Nocardioides sp. SR21]